VAGGTPALTVNNNATGVFSGMMKNNAERALTKSEPKTLTLPATAPHRGRLRQ
jgi:hypothetical protein